MQSTAATQKPAATTDLACVLVILLQPSTHLDHCRYDELQALRSQHDQAFERWLPHVTLVPPFTLSTASAAESTQQPVLDRLVDLHAAKLSEISQAVSQVCSRHEKHSLLLDQVSTFPLRSYTNIHLRPRPTNFTDKRSTPAPATPHSSHRLVQLQADLNSALSTILPKASASRRSVWKPHVSVGQSTSPKATWQLCTSAERLLKLQGGVGLLCDIDRVQLMVKPKAHQGSAYHIHKELTLSK